VAKATLTERVAVLETKVDTLTDRIIDDIKQRRNGRLLKLREVGIWVSLVAILLRLFGAV
jgi:hypothetical protein